MSGSVSDEMQLQQIRSQIGLSAYDGDLHFQEGMLCLKLGDLTHAISAFSRAIELDPYEKTSYVNRAYAYLQRNEYSLALFDLSTASRLDPADALILNDLAAARQRAGEFDLALSDFRSAILLRPDLLGPRLGEGNVLLAIDDYAKAIAVYTRALDIADLSTIHWARGKANLAAGRWGEALRDFNSVQRCERRNRFVEFNRGLCLRELGQLKVAADVFSEILEVSPNDEETLGQRGWTLFRVGEIELAKADFAKCLALNPNDARALFSSSLVYWQAGQVRTAMDFMKRAEAAGHAQAASVILQLQEQIRTLAGSPADQPLAADANTTPSPSEIRPLANVDLSGSPSPEDYNLELDWSDVVVSRDLVQVERVKIAQPPGLRRGTPEAEAAFFRYKYEPPFIPFVGYGKRLSSDLSALQDLAVSFAFPAFLGRAVIDPLAANTPEFAREHPEIFHAGSRAAYKANLQKHLQRRYSGDSAEPLPRSRYFALHGETSTTDNYTLLGECNAYATLSLTGYCAAVPSSENDSITIVFRGFPAEPNPLWSYVSDPNRYSFFSRAWSDPRNKMTPEISSLVTSDTEFRVTIPCERIALEFDRVVDLRYPDARKWMLKIFSDPPKAVDDDDLAHGDFLRLVARQANFDLSEIGGWFSIISVICDRNFGGNSMTEIFASFLRRLGAEALIFPSVRCDSGVVFQNGRMHSSWGWNLVDYRDAPIPRRISLMNPAPVEPVKGINHIADIQLGPMAGSLAQLGNSLYARLEAQYFFDWYAGFHGDKWRLDHKRRELVARGPCWYARTYLINELRGSAAAQCGQCFEEYNYEKIALLPHCPKCGFAGDLGVFVQRPGFLDEHLRPL